MMTDAEKQLRKVKRNQDEFLAIQRSLSSKDGQVIVKYLVKTYGLITTMGATERDMIWNESRRALAMQLAATAFKKNNFAKQITELLSVIELEKEEE